MKNIYEKFIWKNVYMKTTYEEYEQKRRLQNIHDKYVWNIHMNNFYELYVWKNVYMKTIHEEYEQKKLCLQYMYI